MPLDPVTMTTAVSLGKALLPGLRSLFGSDAGPSDMERGMGQTLQAAVRREMAKAGWTGSDIRAVLRHRPDDGGFARWAVSLALGQMPERGSKPFRDVHKSLGKKEHDLWVGLGFPRGMAERTNEWRAGELWMPEALARYAERSMRRLGYPSETVAEVASLAPTDPAFHGLTGAAALGRLPMFRTNPIDASVGDAGDSLDGADPVHRWMPWLLLALPLLAYLNRK